MPDLRCQCGKKIAEYTDTEVRIMDKKCKTVTTLRVVDGKLVQYGESPISRIIPLIKNDKIYNPWDKDKLKPKTVRLYGKDIGTRIANKAKINKQKVLKIMSLEEFEQIVKDTTKLVNTDLWITEIEYY